MELMLGVTLAPGARVPLLGVIVAPLGDALADHATEAALPLGALCAALVSLIIGFPCLRLSGHYLALATFGFGDKAAELRMKALRLGGVVLYERTGPA